MQLQRKLAELEQQISGAYSEKERAEKNTEGMQFRLELQQGKVEELEGTDKTSCRDTTNASRGSESAGYGVQGCCRSCGCRQARRRARSSTTAPRKSRSRHGCA